ncbi:hypothetical protein EZY14_009320 [Kordia sp. TARA_039_SRF]|nr:hypothetical protein EZY14_009320 [Kordia sp. TARA_039_SRF]
MDTKKQTNKKNSKIIGIATATEIAKWKADHTFIFERYVTDPDGNHHIAYLKALNFTELEAAEQTLESDPEDAANIFFNASFLGGSDTIKNYLQFKVGLVEAITEISKPVSFTAKKP